MEGPTPVSALIHAATMVTAGVYLIVRTHSIFEAAPNVQHLSAIIGGVTIVVAGVIALVQWDIKRVIAYSTMSQIGYMFLAAGIGAYGYAMFHLMTHAFFKALLFLSAGVIIHHLGGEQDIRRMGGLRKVMPFTHAAFLVGALALAGIPPLSGFWSKDGIIASALADGGALGYTLVVLGLARRAADGRLHVPALLPRLPRAAVGPRRRALRRARARGRRRARRARPRRGAAVDADPGRRAHRARRDRRPGRDPRRLGAVPRLDRQRRRAARVPDRRRRSTRRASSPSRSRVIGIVIARRAFAAGQELVADGPLRTVLEHKLYFDELYDWLFSRPAQVIANRLRTDVEEPIVQRSLGEIGAGVTEVAAGTARLQSGLLRSYALVIAATVAVLVIVFVAVR